jgi:protein-S-isoprenylcysteine O-methyltransferase Ste14
MFLGQQVGVEVLIVKMAEVIIPFMEREKLIIERYKRIKERGIIKYCLFHGSIFAILIFIFTLAEAKVRFYWFEWLGICFCAGLVWAFVMWLFAYWQYKKHSQL